MLRIIMGLDLWVTLEQRLRQKTKTSKHQFDLMPGRLTIEAIFSLEQLMEKYREKREGKSSYSLYWSRESLRQDT